MKKTVLLSIFFLNTVFTTLAVIYFTGRLFDAPGNKEKADLSEYNKEDTAEAKPAEQTVIEGEASVDIKSAPEEAKIFINGYYKGKTPLIINLKSVKKSSLYKITLIKQDYNKWQEDFEFNPGDKKTLNAELSGVEE